MLSKKMVSMTMIMAMIISMCMIMIMSLFRSLISSSTGNWRGIDQILRIPWSILSLSVVPNCVYQSRNSSSTMGSVTMSSMSVGSVTMSSMSVCSVTMSSMSVASMCPFSASSVCWIGFSKGRKQESRYGQG